MYANLGMLEGAAGSAAMQLQIHRISLLYIYGTVCSVCNTMYAAACIHAHNYFILISHYTPHIPFLQ